MTDKPTETPPEKTPHEPADTSPTKVDRPGFDIGGASGDGNAGTGVGLGPDGGESPEDRRLPGRRGKGPYPTPSPI
ncbi:MAG: hypothetical protein KJ871_07865 [Alphaproteobacteria bacterium]|nr:hypothetical protein [Alphaproteobacteria bacterium]MBU2084877.1 hypothetical protein [Alphaproteobacteria bacterium]MBU2144045.1 hypothetical protein [Alphaproteobacteria bacterium]MBU2198160.1 hypothetical protein [Alphaproteobacteria bacterium]